MPACGAWCRRCGSGRLAARSKRSWGAPGLRGRLWGRRSGRWPSRRGRGPSRPPERQRVAARWAWGCCWALVLRRGRGGRSPGAG
eukprot:5165131-Pyramimonas_sp.AAC.1